MAHPRHERARRGLPMDRLSRRGARRNPDSDKQTCEAVRGAPALLGDGSEVHCANAIREFFPLQYIHVPMYASNGASRSFKGVRAIEVRLLEFGQTLVKC